LVLFRVARDVLVAVVRNVEIELAERRSSWILAIVSAGVVAPDKSMIILVAGNIRSVSNVRIFSISWSAFVTMHRDVASHHASLDLSMAPSVKNLWNLLVDINPSHKPFRKTNKPATTSLACWLRLR